MGTTRRWIEKQFIRHKRHNMVYATPGVHQFVLILDNLKPSFNIAKIFRSCDAFGAKEVHLIGTQMFDTRAAKGSFKWVPAFFHKTFDDCYQSLNKAGYAMYVLEPANSTPLQELTLPVKTAFILGHEERGISFDRGDYPNITPMTVQQVGRVESLNVSIAASIAMYEYFRQHPLQSNATQTG